MKKTILMSAWLMGISVCATAQVTGADTVVVEKADRVTIMTNDDAMTVEVEGRKDDPAYRLRKSQTMTNSGVRVEREEKTDFEFKLPFSVNSGNDASVQTEKPKRGSAEFVAGGFRFGWANALGAPAGMNTPFGKSWEFALRCFEVNVRKTNSPWTFSTGLWLNWRNYRMTGPLSFVKDEATTNIELQPYPQGADRDFSRIKIYSLEVPFTARFRFNKGLRIDVGPIFSFNARTSIKTRYSLDGHKVKDYTRGIHAQRFTVDLLAQFRFSSFGLYVKYSPCNVLDVDYAPKFHGISTGFVLFY